MYNFNTGKTTLCDIEFYSKIEKRNLSNELHAIAKKSVNSERNQRQQSIQQLTEEWEAA